VASIVILEHRQEAVRAGRHDIFLQQAGLEERDVLRSALSIANARNRMGESSPPKTNK
jgi:hypothetical protein